MLCGRTYNIAQATCTTETWVTCCRMRLFLVLKNPSHCLMLTLNCCFGPWNRIASKAITYIRKPRARSKTTQINRCLDRRQSPKLFLGNVQSMLHTNIHRGLINSRLHQSCRDFAWKHHPRDSKTATRIPAVGARAHPKGWNKRP